MEVAARCATKNRDERRLLGLGHLANGDEAPFPQLLRCNRAHAPQPLHREAMEESKLFAGRDKQQPVGLSDCAGHFGEKLGAGYADRDRQANALENLTAQPCRNLTRRARDPSNPRRP